MGGRIPEHVVREIVSRVSIVGVIGDYVRLQSRGDRHVGLCPFHQEKTPSFHVTESRGFYHCFGCKAGGDAVRFLMDHDGLSFPEAVERLAERAGIPIEYEEGGDPAQQKDDRQRRKLYDRAMEGAQRYWEHVLWSESGERARTYLQARGVDEGTARRFGLGYAGLSWTGLVDVALRRVPFEALDRAGLARQGKNGPFDLFRDRLIFPIHSVSRKVVAFSGRALADDAQAKYYNSPETEYFRKGRELYGLHVAHAAIRARECAVLVEGNFDVVSLHALGFDHVVAALGTALTSDQARLLRRFTEHVVLMYDGDAAGRKAARRALDVLLTSGLTRVDLVLLGDGEDPDSVARAEGAEGIAARLAAARPMVDVCVDGYVRRALETGTLEAHVRAAREVATLLAPVDPAVREAYVDQVMRRLGVGRDAFRAQESGTRREPEERPVPIEADSKPLRLAREERVLVEVLVRAPGLLDRVAREEIDGLLPTDAFAQFLEVTARSYLDGSGPAFRDAVAELPAGSLRRTLIEALVAEPTIDEGSLGLAFDDVVLRLKHSWAEREMRRLVEALRDAAGDEGVVVRQRLVAVQSIYRETMEAMRAVAS
jgi:DNA primase